MRAETGMSAHCKTQVSPTIRAVKVEAVWMGEDRRIAIGSTEHTIHRIVRGEFDTLPFKCLGNVASRRLYRAQPAHCFFDGLWN
jgi:hypothetical protein